MKKLLIVGTGDFASVVFSYLKDEYKIIGFAVEKAYKRAESLNDLPVINFEDILKYCKPLNTKILVAIGPSFCNTVRERLYNEVKVLGFDCISYVHPSAEVWSLNAIGENTFIFPKVVVEPYSEIGNNCVLWSGSIVSHHAILKNHCFLAPGVLISGRTIVNSNCFLGINSTIRDNIIIAKNCIIGAGAIIKTNTLENGVYSAKETLLYNMNSFETKL